MERNFKHWISQFRYSISDYKYYTDFKKVYNNVNAIKVELNILNSLIGSTNIEKDFEILLSSYPQILKCIPILLAIRSKEIYALGLNGGIQYNFEQINLTVEEYKIFMRETGLFNF